MLSIKNLTKCKYLHTFVKQSVTMHVMAGNESLPLLLRRFSNAGLNFCAHAGVVVGGKPSGIHRSKRDGNKKNIPFVFCVDTVTILFMDPFKKTLAYRGAAPNS